jgi:hypothetical protein
LLCGPLFLGIGLTLHVVSRHFLELEYLYTHNQPSHRDHLQATWPAIETGDNAPRKKAA